MPPPADKPARIYLAAEARRLILAARRLAATADVLPWPGIDRKIGVLLGRGYALALQAECTDHQLIAALDPLSAPGYVR